VAELIRTQIAPLMRSPSKFADLEQARQRTELALQMLDDTVLNDLERFPESVPSHQLIDVRKLLCVSIGKLHAFLQDAFGEMMANDPRSSHDADYFLSKRFPQDLEEAEWLHSTVHRLQNHLDKLETGRSQQLSTLIDELRREQMIPIGERWRDVKVFLDTLIDSLTPKLKEVLALRGIRFYEMEILDRYAVEIPGQCRIVEELHQAGREAAEKIKASVSELAADRRAEREQSVRDLMICHGVFSRRMAYLMSELDKELRDLMAFIPIWLDSISMRRALVLKRSSDNTIRSVGSR
jgi:hypothetical protein